jgi:hypothetical protein
MVVTLMSEKYENRHHLTLLALPFYLPSIYESRLAHKMLYIHQVAKAALFKVVGSRLHSHILGVTL